MPSQDTSQKTVWRFTNKKELSKSEFINYFERKIFRTIRKHQMLPLDKIFLLKKSTDINTIILKQILETKFEVKYSTNPNISSDNLSQEAENIFKKITKGNFSPQSAVRSPLSPLRYLSDKEIELYAKLKNIKGSERKRNKNIQTLFNKFLSKNQDLEINILKAQAQINENKAK